MNKVILVGNLTRDIELRYMPSGSALATFGLACSRKWKDKNSGEQREEVMFVDIKIFGRSAEVANQYLAKGKKVLIEGRLVLEQWQDQNGNNRSKHTVSCESFEFLDPKGTTSGNDSNMPQNSYQNNQNNQNNNYNQNQTNNHNQQNQNQNYGSGNNNSFAQQNNFSNPAPQAQPNTMSGPPSFEIDDDDIPF
jgi:single-strand DNA-binding protein